MAAAEQTPKTNGSKRAEDYVKHLIRRMHPDEVKAVRERMTGGVTKDELR